MKKFTDDSEHSFSQIGVEANQLLMKIAQKSGLHMSEYGQSELTISPRSNDNNNTVKSESYRVAGISR